MSIKKYCIFAILILSITLPVYGAKVNYGSKVAFFNLKGVNCPVSIKNKVNKKFRKGISNLISEKKMKKVLASKGKKPVCYSNSCAINYGKLLKVKKVVIGSITKVKNKHFKQLGNKGKEQYILKVKRNEYYIINIKIIDVPKGKRLITYKEESQYDDINKTVSKIVKKINKYFKPHPSKKKKSSKSSSRPEINLTIAPSTIIPMGTLRDISDIGLGFVINFGTTHLFFKNSEIMLSYGFHYMFEDRNNIDAFYSMRILLALGYNFDLPLGFRIKPLLGGGYHFHLIDNNGINTYSDPFLIIMCEFNYNFYKNFHLVVTPECSLFFEKKNIGLYMGINLGVKFTF